MESRFYIRNFTLCKFRFSNLRVKLMCVSNVYENLFNSFAIVKHTFFEHCPWIAVHLGCHNNTTNAVYKSMQEFILQVRTVHDRSPDCANHLSICGSYRNICLVIDGRCVSDCIQNVNRAVCKRPYMWFCRH